LTWPGGMYIHNWLVTWLSGSFVWTWECMMVLIKIDGDDWLDIDEYVFYILGLGYIDDFEDLSWLNILPGLFNSCQQVITYSEYHDLPEELDW